jgi:hypothetical protein
MEILKKDILKEMEEKSIDNLNKGIDIAVSILKNEFTFVTGWKYKHDPDFFNSTVYIILICDMDKSSEFYNSPIKDYYKNIEADVTYPFSPLEMSNEIDNEEKYELYKEIQKSLDETYYEIPNDYRHTYKSYISNTDSPKEIYIDGFVFPAPEKLNESESVNDKVSLAKSLIYQLFDEVNYIKISEYHDKPLIKVYFDSDDTAANIESFFTHEICDTLKDYTGGEIVCNPGWGPEWRTNRNNPDILIDAILLKYDDEGNVINESKEDNITEVKRNLKVIKTLLSLVSWDGLCSIWVDYNPEDEEYEIRSKTTASYFDDNNIEQELNSLEDSISSMGIRVYIYTPWYVENCEDEPEFLNEDYSPAGKEIKPNKIVIHKSNPKFRDRISNEGLKAIAGECYKIYAGYGEKCIPAIFATNSTNKRAWFDSTYDDDVWTINTELIPNVKWYKDRHFESSKKHIVTFDNIPSDAIELMREGTGRDMIRESSENKDMTNDIEKNLKAIRMLLKQVSWEGLCDIWVEYNYVDKEYEIRSKSELQDEISPLADIQEELVFLSNIIRSIGLSSYIYGTRFVDNCEDEVKFMDENINESKEESKKEMIENVLNNIILPEYGHVICGFEVKVPNERNTLGNTPFKFMSVTVTFIGGPGTKLWPKTPGIQDMYEDILNEVWDVIYNYTNEGVDVYHKTVKDCGKKNIYLRESKETEPKYLSLIKELVKPFKDEEGVCDIDMWYDDEDDMYTAYLVIGTEEMNEKFFYVPAMNNHISKLRMNVKNTIKQYIPIDNLYVGSYGKPNCGWKPLNENWYKVPSSEFGPLERIINLEMREKYGWWKDIKINTLNYITMYEDVQIEAELTVDEEWGANQWRDFYYSTKFPGNEGWEDDNRYSRRVSLGDITDSTYAEVIRDDLREILKYTLNIDIHNMSFRNVYLIFE